MIPPTTVPMAPAVPVAPAVAAVAVPIFYPSMFDRWVIPF